MGNKSNHTALQIFYTLILDILVLGVIKQHLVCMRCRKCDEQINDEFLETEASSITVILKSNSNLIMSTRMHTCVTDDCRGSL